jgi:hypothetical protein
VDRTTLAKVGTFDVGLQATGIGVVPVGTD